MSTPEYACWLDLETAGTDSARSPIIEVGAILCLNTPDMEIVDRFHAICHLLPAQREAMVQEVVDMHTANGLLAEAMRGDADPIGLVDTRMDRWVKKVTGSNAHVAIAGSGVGHFDRRFISSQMPVTNRRFTYWAYDVGVIRRFVAMLAPEAVPPAPEKPHRAMDDAVLHRDEWLYYANLLGSRLNEAAKSRSEAE